jgi:uncharacterized protein
MRRQSADRRVEHLHGVCQTDHATGTMDRRGHLHQAAGVRGHQEVGAGGQHVARLAGAELPSRLGVEHVPPPAEPQQISAEAISRSDWPGMSASSRRGWARTPCACARWQASWYATDSGSGCRGATGPSSTSTSDTSRTLAASWRFTDYAPAYAGIQAPGGDGEVGGLSLGQNVEPGGPLVLLYSNDLDATVAAVKDAGGTIAEEPYAFPGGRRLTFFDPSGNRLGVWSTT